MDLNPIVLRKLILVVFVWCITGGVQAQPISSIRYSMEDGLPSNTIYYSLEDSKGYLWFSTDAGVAKFDGIEFEVFDQSDGLTSNDVFQMLEDRIGRIWFATFDGRPCFYFDGIIYSEENCKWLAGIKTNDFIRFLEEDSQGNIWFGGNRGKVFQVDPSNRVVEWHVDNIIYGALCLKGGNNYFFDWQGQLFQPDLQGSYALVKTTSDVPNIQAVFGTNGTFSMLPDPKNGQMLLYYLFDERVASLEVSTNQPKFNVIEKLHGKSMIGHGELSDGSLLLTYDGGASILEFNPSDSTYTIKPIVELPGQLVSHVMEVGGDLWVSTLGGGVYYLLSSEFVSIQISSRFPEVVDLFFDAEGHLFFSGENHVFGVWDGISSHLQTSAQDRVRYRGKFQMENEEGIWLTSLKRIFIVQPNLDYREVKAGCVQLEEIGGRMYYMDLKLFLIMDFPAEISQPIRLNNYSNELHCKGIRFAGFELLGDSAAYVIESGKLKYLDFQVPNEMNPVVVEGVDADLKGLSGYKSNDSTHWTWVFSESHFSGFSNDDIPYNVASEIPIPKYSINQILPYQDSLIFVSTSAGLAIFNWNYSSGEVLFYRIFTQVDGLPSSVVNKVLVNNDTLFIATANGLSLVPLQQLNKGLLDEAPIPYIKEVIVDGVKSMPYEDIEVRSGDNSVLIRHTGIHYPSLGNVTFRYRINDGDWNIMTSQSVHFIDLPAGSYTYQVQARSSFGVWDNRPAQLSFLVVRPFYLRGWFLGIVVLGIGLIILGLVRNRIKQVKHRAILDRKASEMELKALKAQMNPHFIFNVLGSIQRYMLANNAQLANEYLTKFSRLTRMVLNHSDKLLVSLNDEIQALRYYIELEQLRLSHRFSFSIEVAPTLNANHIEIPPLFIQVFVENAVWHGLSPLAGGGKLEIVFEDHGDLMKVIVRDNGIGRKSAMERNPRSGESKGSQITMDKLATLNDTIYKGKASIKMVDLYDAHGNAAGTEVQIWLPFNT